MVITVSTNNFSVNNFISQTLELPSLSTIDLFDELTEQIDALNSLIPDEKDEQMFVFNSKALSDLINDDDDQLSKKEIKEREEGRERIGGFFDIISRKINFISSLFSPFSEIFDTVSFLAEILSQMWTPIAADISQSLMQLAPYLQEFVDWFHIFYAEFKEWFKENIGWEQVQEWANDVLSGIEDFWTSINWAAVIDWIMTFLSWIGGFVLSLVDGDSLFSQLWDILSYIFGLIAGYVSDPENSGIVGKIIGFIGSFAALATEQYLNTIIMLANGIIAFFNVLSGEEDISVLGDWALNFVTTTINTLIANVATISSFLISLGWELMKELSRALFPDSHAQGTGGHGPAPPGGDEDGDGWTNQEETDAGTDIYDPSSYPSATRGWVYG